jgi:hypothetical protein
MKSELHQDLKRLAELAFHRVEACGNLISEFHTLPQKSKAHPLYPLMENVRLWLLSPLSLWPVDFVGVGNNILKCIRESKKPDPQLTLLFSFLKKTPTAREQLAIGSHELQVRTGSYETHISAQQKFKYKEEILTANPIFKAEWNAIKAKFNVDKYRDPKGIIRRRMVQERGFRLPGWECNWNKEKSRFDTVFNAFCHRWILYGMEGDKPLLQKLSINVMPLGTMIFIPRYWSFDRKRDLKWGAITKLHRSRGVHRQGEKLGSGEVERIKEAFKAQALWQQSKTAGLKGDRRKDWVIKKMGWSPENDFSKFRRLLKLAAQFTTAV